MLQGNGINHAITAKTYTSIGNIHEEMGELDFAKAFYVKAVKIIIASKDPSLNLQLSRGLSDIGKLW